MVQDPLTQTKLKMPFHFWHGTLSLARFNPIPQSLRPSRRRPRQKSGASSTPARPDHVAALKTSFNPADGLRALQRHRWNVYDLQYVVLLVALVFSFWIAPIPTLIKMGSVAVYTLLVLMPATRQFFLPSLPIWMYLLYFFCSRFIPTEYRPHIWVKVLPALENVLYGANLSNILSEHTYAVLDVLAWIPYGLGHFAGPAFTAVALFLFAAPGTTPVFARAFGYLSLLGVTIQLIFPCTPPWYEKANGLQPAHYGMEGSPAGLARIDAIFGVDMYTTSFTTAPVPFGAFPSLHAADAILEALFLSYCFPRFRALFITYVGWILWATMYLNHHYAVDLVAGGLCAGIFYYVARQNFLPRRQLDKRNRWEYEYVEVGEKNYIPDEELGFYSYSRAFKDNEDYDLSLLQRRSTGDSDEWTIGSSSSFASSSASASGSASSPVSPALSDDGFSHTVVGMTPQGNFWDGQGVGRESELSEVVVVR